MCPETEARGAAERVERAARPARTGERGATTAPARRLDHATSRGPRRQALWALAVCASACTAEFPAASTWRTAGCTGFGARLLVEAALDFTPPPA